MRRLLNSHYSNNGTAAPASLVLIPGFLTPVECTNLISFYQQHPEQVQRFPRERMDLVSPTIANQLWDRFYHHRAQFHIFKHHTDQYGNKWQVESMSSRLQLEHYSTQEGHPSHFDDVHQPSVGRRSFASVVIYLNNADRGTDFFDLGVHIQPKVGLCCIFLTEGVLHEECKLASGDKYMLQTKLMYECPYIKQPDLQRELFELRAAPAPDWGRIFQLEQQLQHQ